MKLICSVAMMCCIKNGKANSDLDSHLGLALCYCSLRMLCRVYYGSSSRYIRFYFTWGFCVPRDLTVGSG